MSAMIGACFCLKARAIPATIKIAPIASNSVSCMNLTL